MWINKFIAHTGYCSRREADKLIDEKRVTINGKIAIKTIHVFENDMVKIDGKFLPPPRRHRIYLALNKPAGVICTTETQVENNIIEFVGHEERVFPVGRMDREMSGIIIMTNDGDIISKFTENEDLVEKEYAVRIDRKFNHDLINGLLDGVEIDGKVVRALNIRTKNPRLMNVVVTDDSRRLIRRMFAKLGFKAFKIERTRVMHITVRDIPLGDWRYLTKPEVMKMFRTLDYHPAQKWNRPEGFVNPKLESASEVSRLTTTSESTRERRVLRPAYSAKPEAKKVTGSEEGEKEDW